MQVQKDVLIAGGVVLVCVALVAVALVATGKKDEPSPPVAITNPSDPYGSDLSGGLGGSGSSGGLGGVDDPYGNYPPPPSGSDGFGGGFDGGSAFAPAPPIGGVFAPSPGLTQPGQAQLPAPAPVVAPAAGAATHTVASGETLGDISATHYGTTRHWRQIVEANPGLDPARLQIGQVLVIPAVAAAPVPAVTPAGPGEPYTVQRGESYYTIARKVLGNGGRWREIERLNGIPAESLRSGQVIRVPARDQPVAGGATGGAPVAGGRTHIVTRGETLGDISKEHYGTTTRWKEIVEANPGVRPESLRVGQSLVIPNAGSAPANAAPTVAGGGPAYVVKSGDTLESIALAHLGSRTAWRRIVEVNPGLKPESLRIGQSIVLPAQAGASPAPPAPAPAPAPFAPAPFAPTPFAPTPLAPPATPTPEPTFQDDPFFSPYDAQPPPAPTRPTGALAPADTTGV